MAITGKSMTADELWRLPNDGQRHELVAGELRTMAPSGSEHGWIVVRVTVPLGQYVETHRLGLVYGAETGFLLARQPDTVRAADVAFVRRERVLAAGDVKGYWPGAPDLAVEVVSPSDLYTEVDQKVGEWLAHGTRLVVVVNPRRRTVSAHRPGQLVQVLTEGDVLDGGDVVPGWTLRVRAVFEHGLAD
jgi:Uma2 family endonuclease